jgi:hypothetical protein
MTYQALKRSLFAAIGVFFLFIAFGMLVVPRLPDPHIWDLVVFWLAFVDWVAIYLILRRSSLFTLTSRRYVDSFLIAFLLVAIPGSVITIWIGGTNWSNHRNAANAMTFLGGCGDVGMVHLEQDRGQASRR